MLDTEDITEYLEEVRKFADKVGLREQLEEKLEYLGTYAEYLDTKCYLGKDFAPYSFSFTMMRRDKGSEEDYQYWFNGGCIFHGPHDNGGDGGAPTFSVNLNPHHGWSIHT